MRTKLVLAAALLGAGGVVLPATSASASCIYVAEDVCIGWPCPADAWNKVAAKANAVLDDAGSPVQLNEWACIA